MHKFQIARKHPTTHRLCIDADCAALKCLLFTSTSLMVFIPLVRSNVWVRICFTIYIENPICIPNKDFIICANDVFLLFFSSSNMKPGLSCNLNRPRLLLLCHMLYRKTQRKALFGPYIGY